MTFQITGLTPLIQVYDMADSIRFYCEGLGFEVTADSGDGLHPSLAGYEAMANAIPLSLFTAPALAAPRDPVQRPRQ